MTHFLYRYKLVYDLIAASPDSILILLQIAQEPWIFPGSNVVYYK